MKATESKLPDMPDDVSRVYCPGCAFESRLISRMPASEAAPVTAIEDVPAELISICVKLPRVNGVAEFKVRLPRPSVCPISGEMVPELANTFPVKVPFPLSVPLCWLKLLSLQTKMGAVSMCPFTLKFALLTVRLP